VVLEFDAAENRFQNQIYSIYINNSLYKNNIQVSGSSDRKIFTISRTEFNSGSNTVRIQPFYASRPWGITNIKAEFTPVVELTLDLVDTGDYGSEEAEERPTGMRASFELESTENDVLFSVTGWDISDSTEIKVYINGLEQGFLSTSANSQYNSGDAFLFAKGDLKEGSNIIELVQKENVSGPKWGVKNLLVVKNTSVPGTLTLGSTDGTKYGRNYGTNENSIALDMNFTPQAEHDHKISWQAFDIEQNDDLEVFLNNTKIKGANTTSNNSLGSVETVTLAWRLFNTGTNTLSFRSKVDGTDNTWGVTNLRVDTSAVIDLDNPDNLDTDFGYFTKYRGGIPLGWTRTYSSQEYQSRLYATFNHTGGSDRVITVTGWDIDSSAEVGVYVNGAFIQHLTNADASSVYSSPDIFNIAAVNLVQGTNTISFRHLGALSGFQNEKWGVLFGIGTGREINLSPIIMLLLDDEQASP